MLGHFWNALNSTTLYLCSGRVPAWCSGWVAFSQSVEFVLWIPLLWLGRASNCYAIQVSSAMYWIQPSNIHFQCGLRWSLLCSWIWCTVLCFWGKILPTIFLFLFKKNLSFLSSFNNFSLYFFTFQSFQIIASLHQVEAWPNTPLEVGPWCFLKDALRQFYYIKWKLNKQVSTELGDSSS